MEIWDWLPINKVKYSDSLRKGFAGNMYLGKYAFGKICFTSFSKIGSATPQKIFCALVVEIGI